jgi:predicted DNA-binding WGR domain protein
MPVTTSTRRFEFVEGTSSKFWSVVVSGATVTVHFGRIGTAGQRETKTFADGAKASKHAATKINEKLRKGYAEVS